MKCPYCAEDLPEVETDDLVLVKVDEAFRWVHRYCFVREFLDSEKTVSGPMILVARNA